MLGGANLELWATQQGLLLATKFEGIQKWLRHLP
jgi:hypothetical protein